MPTEIHLTGFDVFPGVDENPTKILAEDPLVAPPADSGLVLKTRRVLHVHRSAADMAAMEIATEAPAPGNRKLIVHLGVDMARSPVFRLEKTARNDASFGVPDEAGESPWKERIEMGRPWEAAYHSRLDVDAAVATLSAGGFAVERSDDPGRYLCNYIFYRSLQHAQPSDNVDVLFVHVPPHDQVPIDEHKRFLCALFAVLAGE